LQRGIGIKKNVIRRQKEGNGKGKSKKVGGPEN